MDGELMSSRPVLQGYLMADPSAQVKVRMTADQKDKLERAAEQNGLTLNAEILRRLIQTFNNEEVGDRRLSCHIPTYSEMWASAVQRARTHGETDN